MNKILNVYKPIGETPNQLIERLREKFPEYRNEKIGFAGRLDPLAHGVMLFMAGDATKERDKYLNLEKVYEFEALLGIDTDTYDALGIPTSTIFTNSTNDISEQIKIFIKNKIGPQNQQFPPYSSKEVKGKPLHWYARNNLLDSIEIPSKTINIFEFELFKINAIKKEQLRKKIDKNINSVTGDFRQKDILDKWHNIFTKSDTENYLTARFIIHCSSGTYVRSLINELGLQIGTGAIALEIKRLKAGKYDLKDSIKL